MGIKSVTPGDPLYQANCGNPQTHEYLVRTNVVWFLKDNEMLFRYPKILSSAATSEEFHNQCPAWGKEDYLIHYMNRMSEILAILKQNQWAAGILSAAPYYLDSGTDYTPTRQSFEMVLVQELSGGFSLVQPGLSGPIPRLY